MLGLENTVERGTSMPYSQQNRPQKIISGKMFLKPLTIFGHPMLIIKSVKLIFSGVKSRNPERH